MIDCINLTKQYDGLTAVDAVTFSVKEGELFGLIGPDGAGKSTIFRMLTTLVLPDGGAATVQGFDIVADYKKIRHQVGYMPAKFSLYQDLTVQENLDFFATIFNTTIEENYDLIHDIYIQIAPFKARRAGDLSGGMKQKLALCCALIHQPKVLFLDEPTTGVDAVSRQEFWQMLQRLKAQGMTILVSTPYMDEANLCERIALMQTGKMMSIDTPDGIVSQYQGDLFAVQSNAMSRLLRDLRAYEYVKNCFAFGDFHHFNFSNIGEGQVPLLLNYLNGLGHEALICEKIRPTIEDCFIQLMQ
ncbi:ABC transporter ATP-binding protein [Persicobacter psychrovividus]|uniref:ABC transporter domain-containing protein n=1 Tax=Persicobacter psychrovividus TaxID=387638 RepID=A0ABN6LDE0_9BACT|nr:hypothetical protein PEPS_34250 [Persicobacter psychrovividus]